MRIIYARMAGYNFVSTPSDAVVRELENLGHTIFWTDNLSYLPTDKYDFVFSPYESATILGDAISKILNIPHYAHIEVIPPWRYIENIDFQNYGLSKDDPELHPEMFKGAQTFYKRVLAAYKDAILCSTSNECRLSYMQTVSGRQDIVLRYPSIDVRTINCAKKMYSPRKDPKKMITISRATAIKRYDLLIKVMNEIKTSGITWTIIGDGPMTEVIKKELVNPNIKLELLGAKWGWEKWYELMKASYMIFGISGMPPIEGILLDVVPFGIESSPTKHLPERNKLLKINFGNNMPLFSCDEIVQMANMIDEKMNSDNTELLSSIKEDFIKGKMNVTSSETNANQIIERISHVI